MMKSFCAILLLLVLLSCNNHQNDNHVVVDLNDVEERLEYSSFVDSVSYITLCLEEDMHLGNIERLYKRGEFYYVWGTHQSGIYIFDIKGDLYSHINAYGEGPTDFRDISSFSVVYSTGDVCIMDYASQKLKYYGVNGDYLYSEPCPNWCVDLIVPNTDSKIFISPFYMSENNPNGIWVGDKNNTLVKQLIDDVTPEHKFYYYPMTYNFGDSCFYYYDRNWNYFSIVSEKGVDIMHRFVVKQSMSSSLMENAMENIKSLNGYSICDRFAYSHSNLLMLFCRFAYKEDGAEHSYIWVMMDNQSKQLKLAYELYNDLDNVKIENRELFYLDEKTWGRVLDEDPDNFDIHLQLLHLK